MPRKFQQTGQDEWIRSIVESHAATLVRYAASINGSVEAAQDAVQETFLRLCREERAKIEDHVVPWLFRVCRSRALDQLRKDGRLTALNVAMLATKADQSPRPDSATETSDASEEVLQLLDTLPPRQQEALRLKFQNGLSYKEIAAVMDTSTNNVGFLIHTALKSLRQRLNKHSDLLDKDVADG